MKFNQEMIYAFLNTSRNLSELLLTYSKNLNNLKMHEIHEISKTKTQKTVAKIVKRSNSNKKKVEASLDQFPVSAFIWQMDLCVECF